MAFGLSKGKISPIAIDFGADSLKMLQVVPGEPTQVVAAACVPVPEAARVDPAARLSFMEDAVKQQLKALPFRGKRAICAIPGFQMLIHNFCVSRCDAEDINAMTDLALRERLGIEPARMIIRNTHALDHHRHGEAKTDVICMAAQREMVMQYLQLAGRAKLEVLGMHPEPQATVKALEPEKRGEAVTQCLIDLGCATTKVMVANGGTLRLAKTINAGGESRIRRIAKRENLAFADARARRVEALSQQLVGVGAGVGEGGGGGDAGGFSADEDDLNLTDRVTATLVDELRAVRRHDRGRFPEAPIQRLVFCGGEARDAGVRDRLAACFGISATVADPTRGMSINPAEVDLGDTDFSQPCPEWTVAAGLCMSDANL